MDAELINLIVSKGVSLEINVFVLIDLPFINGASISFTEKSCAQSCNHWKTEGGCR